LSADAQCQANASSFQNTGTLIDCAPGYNYVNAIKYIWRFKNLKYIQELHQLVDDFIPEISKAELRKKKRSFWHFWGAATTKDVKFLEDNIRNLQSATEVSLRSFAQLADKYSSFMNLSNEHLQQLATVLAKQTANSHKNLRNVNAAITFLFNLILAHSDYVDTAFLLHHFETQIRELLDGRLPRDLIPPAMLQEVRANISLFLKKYEVPLYLPEQHSADWYENAKFVLAKRHNKIYITLSFPLSITRVPLILYQLTVLQMPIDSDNKHASYIKEFPKFAAYGQTQDWFLEFDGRPNVAKDGLYLIQNNPTALHHRENPTCFSAIMAQERTNIQRLCEFVIQPYAAKPRVSILHNNRLLLQFVQQYTLVCPNETKIYEGCQLCLLEIKCLCKFIAGRDQYFAKIAHCESHLPKEHRVQYAVNLNFLQEFFNASELIPDSQQFLDYLPRILLPNLTFEQDQITQSLGLLSSSIFNMSKVSQASLNDSAIFLDLGAIIEAKFQKLDLDLNQFSIKTIEMVLTLANPVIIILTVIGLIRLHLRFQALSVAVGLIRPARANVLHQPNKLWAPNLWRTPRPINEQQQNIFTIPAMKPLDLETISATALIFGILVTIVLFIVLRYAFPLLWRCCKQMRKTVVKPQASDSFKVLISIGNAQKYVCLELMHLPFSVEEYSFNASKSSTALKVQGCLTPILRLKWPDLQITHKFAPLTYDLIKAKPLTYLQAYHLKKILAQPHYVLFHLREQGKIGQILPLAGSLWASLKREAPLTMPHQTRRRAEQPPLYPALAEMTSL
jgi:hypothetical protein